jgi:hypothetical protein
MWNQNTDEKSSSSNSSNDEKPAKKPIKRSQNIIEEKSSKSKESIEKPLNKPEEFSSVLCDDLGLPENFKSKVAHHLRGQLQGMQRQME